MPQPQTKRSELEAFLGAIRFFTRLPVPDWVGHGSDSLERSARYFPAVGLIVGGIGALVFGLFFFIWPKTLAILGMGAIKKRPVVVTDEDGNDSIAIRETMFSGLSFDHRIIDGAVADQFMAVIKKELETSDFGLA